MREREDDERRLREREEYERKMAEDKKRQEVFFLPFFFFLFFVLFFLIFFSFLINMKPKGRRKNKMKRASCEALFYFISF